MKFPCSICLMLIALTGCGGATGNNSVVVAGKVTLNDAPLETGTISLIPADGQGASAAINIVNGEFETTIAPGKKLVRIYAEKVAGQQLRNPSDPNSEKYDVMQPIIPKQYNEATTLTLDVPAEGIKTAAFPLKSK